jgi:hypothetical protein
MTPSRSFQITPRLIVAMGLGFAVLALVLLRFDMRVVLASLARAGLGGFALIVLAGLAAEMVLAIGIVPLLPRPMPFFVVVAARQLRDSSADVLPITQLGGVALAARTLVLAGMGVAKASAAVIADLTAETFAQGLYVLMGVLTSLSLLSTSRLLSAYVGAMLGGAMFLSAGSIGFALFQVGGSRWAPKLGERLFPTALIHAHAFRQSVGAIYAHHGRLALSIALQLVFGPPLPSRRWWRACAAPRCSFPPRSASRKPVMPRWPPYSD